MQFRTPVNIPESEFKIDYQKQTLLLGSCFSDNVGNQLKYYKLPTLINPFGVLYNPVSVKNALVTIMGNRKISMEDLHHYNDLWISFYHGTEFSGPDKEKVYENISSSIQQASEWFSTTDLLTITFGTSWAYKLRSNGMIVANCHKLPAKYFERVFIPAEEIVDSYATLIHQIYRFNPNVRILFTVSPVRHLKDGLVENQKSKSNLIISIHRLLDRFPEIKYFPSYEIMMDELRDYRFYSEDMTHLNKTGIQYIWERFSDTYVSTSSHSIMKEVEKIQKAIEHRPFKPNSKEHIEFLEKQAKKAEKMMKKYPFLDLRKERDNFREKYQK
ncbi:MAG: GSCFA domain-containing protein [Bacteroidales bacterium]